LKRKEEERILLCNETSRLDLIKGSSSSSSSFCLGFAELPSAPFSDPFTYISLFQPQRRRIILPNSKLKLIESYLIIISRRTIYRFLCFFLNSHWSIAIERWEKRGTEPRISKMLCATLLTLWATTRFPIHNFVIFIIQMSRLVLAK